MSATKGPAEDVGTLLKSELARLRGIDPFRALGVAPTANAQETRSAYLTATKAHHPMRFARESVEVRELATEVFLLVRKAYEQIDDDAKRGHWRDRLAPVAPPAPTPAPAPASAVVPPTVRPGSVPGTSSPGGRRPTLRPAAEVQAMLEAARTRQERFDDACHLLARGRYKEAREALVVIAAEDPQAKRYRVQLHLAGGLEHLAEGRSEKARRELERAFALDPECTEASRGLAKLAEAKPRGGFWGRIFGR